MFIISIGHLQSEPTDNKLFFLQYPKGRAAQRDGFTEVSEHITMLRSTYSLGFTEAAKHSRVYLDSSLCQPNPAVFPTFLCHVTETNCVHAVCKGKVLICTCPSVLLEGPFPLSLQVPPRGRQILAWVSAQCCPTRTAWLTPRASDVQWFYSGPKREITQMSTMGKGQITIQVWNSGSAPRKTIFHCKDLK